MLSFSISSSRAFCPASSLLHVFFQSLSLTYFCVWTLVSFLFDSAFLFCVSPTVSLCSFHLLNYLSNIHCISYHILHFTSVLASVYLTLTSYMLNVYIILHDILYLMLGIPCLALHDLSCKCIYYLALHLLCRKEVSNLVLSAIS